MDVMRLGMEATDTLAGLSVVIYVNEYSLVELVRAVELPFAEQEGQPGLAGKYVGLPPSAPFLPSRHLLGVRASPYKFCGKVLLLARLQVGL